MTETMEKCLQTYSQIINDNPLLSRKEELTLIKTIVRFRSGQKRQVARDKIINSNLRLVLKEAHRYNGCSKLPLEDLIQAGIHGLSIAVDRFNPKKYGTKLSTFAVPWIRLKIFDIIISDNSSVYVPPHIIHLSQRYKKFIVKNGSDKLVNDKELMEFLDVTKRGLTNIRLAQHPVISLNQPAFSDEESSQETIVQDFIADTKPTPTLQSFYEKEKKIALQNQLKKLNDISRKVIFYRYLAYRPRTLNEVGKKLKLTGERIRQIEFAALRKLRRKMEGKTEFLP